MAELQFQLKIPGPGDAEPGIQFGMAIIGTTKEQRDAAVLLLRRAATKIEDDTMKKFGTGEVLPEPDDDQTLAPPLTDEDRKALAEESDKEAGDD